MCECKNCPQERIIQTAITLFSEKGFSGVGVREIAREADVNISMISYYFNGKIGILKNIMERFFDGYIKNFKLENLDDMTIEQAFRQLVSNIVYYIKDNTQLVMVAYNELPLNNPEIAQYKAQRITEIVKNVRPILVKAGINPFDFDTISVIGPALIASLITNFRFQPVLVKTFKRKINDQYYEDYIDKVCHLFLNGITGMIKNNQEN